MPSSKCPPPGKHAARAQWYAERVVAREIPAGPWVRLACQKHLDELVKSEKKAYPYRFDAETGSTVCEFIECLKHTKGKWAAQGESIVLEAWQCFLVVVGFGWLRKSDGLRRFNTFYWEIPRKNGKSLLAAAILNYLTWADGEFGAEGYSGATTEKQAWEVFGPARLMMSRSPELAKHLGVEVRAKTMIRESDGSKCEPIIGNPGDGSSPSCAVIDEFHEHDTPAQVDSMETGMGAREQPVLFLITTAGVNIAGPCHEKHEQAVKVLQGVLDQPELFACIFGIDEGDDPFDPKALIKANPNYDVSVKADFLRQMQRNAMASPAQQAIFKTKHLNVWTSVLHGMFNMVDWSRCGDANLDEDDLIDAGADCYFGVDLASKLDLCAEARLYKRRVDDRLHFYLFSRYWLPESAVEEPGPNHAHYLKWRALGLLIQTEGATVDFELITAEVLAHAKRSNPIETVYDPFNATQFAQALSDHTTVVEFIQQPHNFAVPIDELQAAIKDGRFHHDANPITTWCMSNVVARPAKKGLSSPIKAKPHQKIDGAIAAIIAMARAAEPETAEPDYSNPVIV